MSRANGIRLTRPEIDQLIEMVKRDVTPARLVQVFGFNTTSAKKWIARVKSGAVVAHAVCPGCGVNQGGDRTPLCPECRHLRKIARDTARRVKRQQTFSRPVGRVRKPVLPKLGVFVRPEQLTTGGRRVL